MNRKLLALLVFAAVVAAQAAIKIPILAKDAESAKVMLACSHDLEELDNTPLLGDRLRISREAVNKLSALEVPGILNPDLQDAQTKLAMYEQAYKARIAEGDSPEEALNYEVPSGID